MNLSYPKLRCISHGNLEYSHTDYAKINYVSLTSCKLNVNQTNNFVDCQLLVLKLQFKRGKNPSERHNHETNVAMPLNALRTLYAV